MGMLINGKWEIGNFKPNEKNGHFDRPQSTFRQFISATPTATFPAEKKRYHLYLSLACPWAHRTLIFLRLKQLTDIIDTSIVHPHMLENGWAFKAKDGATIDKVNHFDYLNQVYTLSDKHCTTRVTVPVLFDTKEKVIVNNESAEIIRMFNNEFNSLTDNHDDYYPEKLQNQIDDINTFIYHNINNGVYKVGFATTQEAYEQAFYQLFSALDELEKRLSQNTYLMGDRLTEADWRLFTTIIRFDAVYFNHFKTNLKRICDYPHLYNYLKRLYHYDGIKETVDFFHIKQHYFFSHTHINPSQIVPIGPELSL